MNPGGQPTPGVVAWTRSLIAAAISLGGVLGGEVLAALDPADVRAEIGCEAFAVRQLLELVCVAPDHSRGQSEVRQAVGHREGVVDVEGCHLAHQ